MPSGVYQIRNTKTQKRYIGSGVSIRDRWAKHQRTLRAGTHHNVALQNAWNKYGADVFLFELLEEVTVLEQLVVREQAYLDGSPRKMLYNIRRIAESNLGLRHTQETREKQRQAKLGWCPSAGARELNRQAHLGKRATKATRQKMSRAHSGVAQTKEHAIKRGRATGKSLRKQSPIQWNQINTIRREWMRGVITQSDLATRYRVTQGTIYKIVHNKSWTPQQARDDGYRGRIITVDHQPPRKKRRPPKNPGKTWLLQHWAHLGKQHTEETKQKLSRIRKKRYAPRA